MVHSLSWIVYKTLNFKSEGLIFVDGFGDNVEFRFDTLFYNYTASDGLEFAQDTLIRRFSSFLLVRFLAVPWGFGGFFCAPRNEYALPQKYDEYAWFYQSEKTWATQYQALRALYFALNTNSLEQYNYGLFNKTSVGLQGKPILQIFSNKTDEMICNDDSDSCKYSRAYNRFLIHDSIAISKVTGNSLLYGCDTAQCNLGMPQRFPGLIVSAVEKFKSEFTKNKLK